jgi:AraC family transcriptional regulator
MSEFYLKRIYATQNFIEIHYNKSVSISELENISCYSYRNLQRIFFSLFHETIGAYQTRLKVENGYKKLLYSKKQISDIAIEVGFSDLQSFSKTFKKHFSLSPSVARSKKELLLNEDHPIHSIPYILNPEIVFIPETTVYYSSCKTSYVNPDIELLWDSLLINDFPEANASYFGVITDDLVITEKSKCSYDACIATDIIIKNLPVKTIFGGNYVRFSHHGSYDLLEETYQQIYGGWFLDNAFEFSHTPVIEQYLINDSNSDKEADYLTAIFIPLS